jgi:hypothetical protein
MSTGSAAAQPFVWSVAPDELEGTWPLHWPASLPRALGDLPTHDLGIAHSGSRGSTHS